MTKILKNFEMFPSGSYAYNISREIKTGKDIKQCMQELAEEYKLKRALLEK